MASSSQRYHGRTRSSITKHFFETVVFPHEARIHVGFEFVIQNRSRLDISRNAFVIAENGKYMVTRFGRDTYEFYMTNGMRVAEEFGYKQPTKVRIEFLSGVNRFKVFNLGSLHGASVNNKPKIEVIDINSDEEVEVQAEEEEVQEEEEDESDDDGYFVQPVTTAMARMNKKQVLHFPSRTSVNVIKEKQTSIILRDVSTKQRYKCRVITGRAKYEKYLGSEWFKFLDDRRPRKGDKLMFQVMNPPKQVLVELIRRKDLI